MQKLPLLTTISAKQQLFVRSQKPYDALVLTCKDKHNLGVLEKRYASGGHPGTLNVKKELVNLIEQAGGDFEAEPGFVPAQNGMLRRCAGTGYIGWKDFGSMSAAIKYLEQYFDISNCDNEALCIASADAKHDIDKTVCCSSTRERKSKPMGKSGDGSTHSRAELESLGFLNLGEWTTESDSKLKDVGDDVEVWNDVIQKDWALYAFCCGEEVLYIGKTSRSINQRFIGYRKPGAKQTTNLKCHRHIKVLLSKKNTVRILIFPDSAMLQWSHFRINLAAGLEDALVTYFKPQLNGGGSRGQFITTTSEDEQIAESQK